MYKRPPLRVSGESYKKTNDPIRAPPGTFLHKLLNPPPTVHYKSIKQPVYQKEAYLSLLEKNNKELGIPYERPEIPDYVEPMRPEKTKEPHIEYSDQVQIKLRYLKSGIIRVKLDTSFPTLYEKYYSKQQLPPTKSIIQAYKSLGFSEEFLDRVKQNLDNKADIQKRVATLIDNVFNKEPVKKTKKKKKEEELVEEEPSEEQEELDEDDEVGDDDDPGEDGEMDVEVDNDDEDQPQQDEEEYFSD
jgi:hypothetical protein